MAQPHTHTLTLSLPGYPMAGCTVDVEASEEKRGVYRTLATRTLYCASQCVDVRKA